MQPGNPEPMRRSIARWLSPLPASAVNPSQASARGAADALGVSVEELLPADDEEDQALARDLMSVLIQIVERHAHERGAADVPLARERT